MRVLVVDDEMRVCRSYSARLRADGHAVDEARSLPGARAALVDVDYDCVVVGTLAADGGPREMIAEARRQRPTRPVLVVSGGDDADRRIEALEAGADDSIARPVSLDELSLRVRKLIVRGSSPRPADAAERLGRVALHRGRREVTVDGRRIGLTPIQYALFEYLLANRSRIVSAAELLQHCWDWNHPARANPLPPQISRLRKAFQGAVRIESTRGVGYRLRVVDPEASPSGF